MCFERAGVFRVNEPLEVAFRSSGPSARIPGVSAMLICNPPVELSSVSLPRPFA